MPYQSETIATILNRLNIQYLLPAIQREFVWDPPKVVKLFDSLLRGYPIGSFLFWELQPESRDNWDIYKFIEHGHQGGAHNATASPAGVQQLTLVLDGQQRLTSLLIGLKGSYTVKRKYRRKDDPTAWVRQYLHLDLLKDPRTATEEDDEPDIYYGLAFEDKPVNEDGHYWFRVSRILDFSSEDRFYEFRQQLRKALPGNTPLDRLDIAERNLERLYRAVWRDPIVSYYTEHDQDYDRVLDIFARTNQGGTPLSKSDLLLSTITLRWTQVNAREDVNTFVDRLNKDLTRKNDLDKDFVLKAALVLSDLPVQYKVNNFNKANIATMERKWASIKAAIETCVDIVNSFGIDRDTLTSANALIPIAYFLVQRNMDLHGSTPYEVRNAQKIRNWLVGALLNNVFGGASDTILREIRDVLRKNPRTEDDYPVEDINKAVAIRGRVGSFNQTAIDNFLDITYRVRESFLALSILYDDHQWGIRRFHRDHIFPRYLFSVTNLQKAGVPSGEREDFVERMDHTGNLELLLDRENQEKATLPFDEWIATRDQDFKSRHLIPDDPALYSLQRFGEFIKAREDLIRQRLTRLFGPGA